jgi:membrane associated rhomboid family serine protease
MTDGVSSGPAGTPGFVVPTCYRHPGRETYIRCTRCERPICPDCMNAAPVGFQCPECVREGQKSVRQPRTALGGEITDRGDLVTKILIGVNVLVFLTTLVSRQAVPARLGLYSVSFFQGEPIGVADGEWWRLLTAAFLHVSVFHLLLNMYALWILGQALEPVVGRWRFTALYFISALGGSAVSVLALPPGTVSLGASGAVFGLFGALFVIMRRLGRDLSGLIAVLAINVVLIFVFAGIDWRAHLGGLATGSALAAAFAYAPRQHRTAWSVAACGLAVAVSLLLVVFRVNALSI